MTIDLRRPARLSASLAGLAVLFAMACSQGPSPTTPPPLLDKLLGVPVQQACPGSMRVRDEIIAAIAEGKTVDPAVRRDFYRRVEAVQAIQARWERELLAKPDVSGIGVTIDKKTGEPMFLVIAESSADVPKTIEGVAVRVENRGPVRLVDSDPNCGPGNSGAPCHIEQQPFPVAMGNSARWIGAQPGCSLGFKACDPGTGQTAFVTASHCAQFAGSCALADLEDPVKHPSFGDADASGGNAETIGEISGHAAPSCGSNSNFLDATRVDSSCLFTSRAHRDIGVAIGEFENPMPGDPVQYSGRTSGFNYGSITAIGCTIEVPQGAFCCGSLMMHDQILFDNVGAIQGGDSGAGVLGMQPSDPNVDRRVAGLLWGQNECGGLFNNVSRVLDELTLTLDFSPCAGAQAPCTQ